MKERYCKYLEADSEGCYCTRSPQEDIEKHRFCNTKNAKECPYFEAEYDNYDKELVKDLLAFMQKEVKKIGKMTTTDSFGERPLLFFEAFGELIKIIKKKYDIK